MKSYPIIEALVGKGPPFHKSSSKSGQKHNCKVMDGWRQRVVKPTLERQSMVGMTTSILPKEGKTNEYRSRTSGSK